MILTAEKKVVEKSGKFQSANFGFANKAFIFDLLRSKIYSNPIKVVCQEIMCNARDAHREINKEHIPIRVKVPTIQDPRWICQDFGPGITPERMQNIFILYGASTKREDNVQTGGFGIGAKTPWAYTDSFGIVSVTPDENGQMIRREYLAYIDESNEGTLSLLNTGVTNDPQGTSIVVGVAEKDFNNFSKYTEVTARHWDVCPDTDPGIQSRIKSFKDKILFENEDFILNGYSCGNYTERSQVIIDGISYPFPADSSELSEAYDSFVDERHLINRPKLNQYNYHWNSLSNNFGISLKFKVGEIAVSASREQIDINKIDKNAFLNKVKNIFVEYPKKINKELAEIKDISEATEYVRCNSLGFKNKDLFISNSLSDLLNIEWNGISYFQDYQKFDINEVDETKVILKTYFLKTCEDGGVVITSPSSRDKITFEPKKGVPIIFDDCPRQNIKKIYTLFLKYNVTELPVITCRSKTGSRWGRDGFTKAECIERYKEALLSSSGNIKMRAFNPVILSEIEDTKIPKKSKQTPQGERLRRYCRRVDYVSSYGYFKNEEISLKDDSFYYLPYFRNDYFNIAGNTIYDALGKTRDICRYMDIERVYLIKQSDMKFLGNGSCHIEVVLKKNYKNFLKSIKGLTVETNKTDSFYIKYPYLYNTIENCDKQLKSDKDFTKTMFYRYYELSKEVRGEEYKEPGDDYKKLDRIYGAYQSYFKRFKNKYFKDILSKYLTDDKGCILNRMASVIKEKYPLIYFEYARDGYYERISSKKGILQFMNYIKAVDNIG